MKSNYITCWQFLSNINVSHHFSLDWNSLYYQKYLHYQMEKRNWSFQSTCLLYTPVAPCFPTIPSCSVFTALELIWHLAVCSNCLCLYIVYHSMVSCSHSHWQSLCSVKYLSLRRFNNWMDSLHRWHSITIPQRNWLSSWERPILSQMFAEKVLTEWHTFEWST